MRIAFAKVTSDKHAKEIAKNCLRSLIIALIHIGYVAIGWRIEWAKANKYTLHKSNEWMTQTKRSLSYLDTQHSRFNTQLLLVLFFAPFLFIHLACAYIRGIGAKFDKTVREEKKKLCSRFFFLAFTYNHIYLQGTVCVNCGDEQLLSKMYALRKQEIYKWCGIKIPHQPHLSALCNTPLLYAVTISFIFNTFHPLFLLNIFFFMWFLLLCSLFLSPSYSFCVAAWFLPFIALLFCCFVLFSYNFFFSLHVVVVTFSHAQFTKVTFIKYTFRMLQRMLDSLLFTLGFVSNQIAKKNERREK